MTFKHDITTSRILKIEPSSSLERPDIMTHPFSLSSSNSYIQLIFNLKHHWSYQKELIQYSQLYTDNERTLCCTAHT